MAYGIITHYDVHNHGAVLQLNALVKVLYEQFGITAYALRFDKNYDFMGRELKAKYEISIRSVGIYLKYLQNNGLKRVLFNMKKKWLLDKFKEQEALIGEYYTRCGELDGVIVGSDEVFALHTGPTPVFFGHACPSKKVFAYAGSFGPTGYEDIEKYHCLPFVRSGLESMAGVSVRDRNSFEIVSRLVGREPALVCDPVLLYGYERERACFRAVDQPPYLLVYAYDNNMNDPEEVGEIRAYARAKGLQIVSAGFYHEWCDRNINVDPIGLLNYFASAACVVTDTFHGSVMSILNGCNLAVRTRGNGNKLCNLLAEYGLTDRILSPSRPLGQILSEQADYADIQRVLIRRRNDSMVYLASMIQSCQQ